MNYFEHHIGDYDQATAHLTACEDGIYSRLIRWYYADEHALPNDLKVIQRRVRARSREEKEAVETVLGEFFELREDGYHQHRCDEGIARFQDKQAKAKRSAEARWSAQRPQSEGNANASADGMRTHSEGNAPRARHQSPIPIEIHPPIPPAPESAAEHASASAAKPSAKASAKSAPVGLRAWIAGERAAGRKLVPDTDVVFAYADEVRLPREYLHLAWLEFRHRYEQPDAKRYRDWRSVFRKAVRGNWLKLWYAAGDGYDLTTTGIQAQRAHQERAA